MVTFSFFGNANYTTQGLLRAIQIIFFPCFVWRVKLLEIQMLEKMFEIVFVEKLLESQLFKKKPPSPILGVPKVKARVWKNWGKVEVWLKVGRLVKFWSLALFYHMQLFQNNSDQFSFKHLTLPLVREFHQGFFLWWQAGRQYWNWSNNILGEFHAIKERTY